MAIGDILKELREDQGLTQRELASLLGISHASVSAYEVGSREPSLDTLAKYVRIFRVSADYLLGLINEPLPPAVLSAEYSDGISAATVVKNLLRLESEQRRALLHVLENLQFYADVIDQIKRKGDQKK